jgi:glyoxylase-like metal-dependent hydrolase (beta-lactamase superfamily II)
MITIASFVFNSFQVNTYIIRNRTGDALIIDPAFYSPEEINTFDRYIISNNIRIIGQLNTHCHVDHVLGVHHMENNYHCPIRSHSSESGLLNNAPLMGEFYGFKVEPHPGIEHPVEDGESIPIGEESLRAILVPGHSPGSLAFHSPEGGFIITGDTLFRGSIGRTDLPGGDYDTLIRSIRGRLLTLPPDTIVYPGHGDPTTIGEESTFNPFLSMV